jgi:hypothetical protein
MFNFVFMKRFFQRWEFWKLSLILYWIIPINLVVIFSWQWWVLQVAMGVIHTILLIEDWFYTKKYKEWRDYANPLIDLLDYKDESELKIQEKLYKNYSYSYPKTKSEEYVKIYYYYDFIGLAPFREIEIKNLIKKHKREFKLKRIVK